MSYPEPSRHDCGADWNRVTLEDDDGEEYDACGCTSCTKARREEALDASGYYDDLYQQRKDEGYY